MVNHCNMISVTKTTYLPKKIIVIMVWARWKTIVLHKSLSFLCKFMWKKTCLTGCRLLANHQAERNIVRQWPMNKRLTSQIGGYRPIGDNHAQGSLEASVVFWHQRWEDAFPTAQDFTNFGVPGASVSGGFQVRGHRSEEVPSSVSRQPAWLHGR